MRPFLILLLSLVLAPALRAQETAATAEPQFLIEGIVVEGGSRGSDRIVVSQSGLKAGQTYAEGELRAATSRIQRLPFVIATDFRLAKGSSFGRYILVIAIQQMKPVFLQADSTTLWSLDQHYLPQPNGDLVIEDRLNQSRSNRIAVGARQFIGPAGMLTLAAERVEHRNDRYTVSYSQYDLFGTRASITALVSYLDEPGARGRGAPGDRYDWHFRDNLTYELIGIIPLGRNDSLRGSWQRSDRPVSYFTVVPGTGALQHNLRSLPEIRKELFWIHDTTDDPLFPTSGTRITAGTTRSDMPTYSFFNLGRVKLDELKATIEQSFPLTPRQALTTGAEGLDFDRTIRKYDLYARYSFDVWGRDRTVKNGDLRFEISADRVFSRIRDDPFSGDSTVGVGLVFRNEWGVLRLTGKYNAWRTR